MNPHVPTSYYVIHQMTKKIDKICDFFVAWSSVEYLIALQFEILNSCLNLLITCPLNCNKTSRKIAHTIKPNWHRKKLSAVVKESMTFS